MQLPFFELKQSALDCFLRYVRIDTQSCETADCYPSTKKQFDLAHLLVTELQTLGISDAQVDEHCCVTATLPSSSGVTGPVIGLMAHLDTSPEVSGENVAPRIIESYDGGDIVVSAEWGIVIREDENPDLQRARGHTIVTAGGETLLGADDKAGIAAIMAAVSHLFRHPEIARHQVRIGFTPDEEVGRGADFFDIGRFGADLAFTIDGGFTGELNNETFSADAAAITVTGRDMHPGTAKDRMVNSVRVLSEIVTRLPKEMAPETTCEREGYLHPHSFEGCVGSARLKILLRDFAEDGLKEKRALLERIIREVQPLFPKAKISLEVSPTYRNMFQALQERPEALTRLEQAVRATGIEPLWKPIRGGTDGAVLTDRGLPTPNIFTAACNAHSLTEWLDVDGLVKAVETVIHLVTVE